MRIIRKIDVPITITFLDCIFNDSLIVATNIKVFIFKGVTITTF